MNLTYNGLTATMRQTTSLFYSQLVGIPREDVEDFFEARPHLEFIPAFMFYKMDFLGLQELVFFVAKKNYTNEKLHR